VNRRRSLLLAAVAFGALVLLCGTLALLLRPGPGGGGSVAPQPDLSPAPLPQPEPASPGLAQPALEVEPEQREPSTALEPVAPAEPPRGTLVVVLTGPGTKTAHAIEVLVSDWRKHAGAVLEQRTRTYVPAGLLRTELQLPGGSYSVRAQAPGWASASVRADLGVRSPSAQVELRLVPSTSARGVVLQHDGSPAADVPVHVVDAADQWLATARTGHDGGYALDGLPALLGRLVVGSLAGPLVAPLEVDLSAPLLRVPDVTLAPTGRIAVEVRDEFGASVPDLALTAQSDSGVRLELASDASGLAVCAHVPPGAWRVFGDAGPLGRGNAVFEVAADAESRVELRLRR
jgi:hypothetical protein